MDVPAAWRGLVCVRRMHPTRHRRHVGRAASMVRLPERAVHVSLAVGYRRACPLAAGIAGGCGMVVRSL